MNTNHPEVKPDASITLEELARKVEDLSRQVSLLVEELHWKQAEDIAARIDRGEERLFPLELAKRVIVDDEPPLKVFREWRGLTQEELAQKAGTSKGYISQIETRHRQPSRKLLYRLAEALDVSPELLLEEPPEED